MEYLSGKPLCMDQYYQILSSCRVPGPRRDTVVNHAIGKTSPTHITVVHNFQVFEPPSLSSLCLLGTFFQH